MHLKLRSRASVFDNATSTEARIVLATISFTSASIMHTFSPYTRILSYGRCQLKRLPPFALTSLGGARSPFVGSAVVGLDKRVTFGTAESLSPRTLPIIRQTQGLYPARLRSISQNSGAMASGHKITHVLFDMDGLLLSKGQPYRIPHHRNRIV